METPASESERRPNHHSSRHIGDEETLWEDDVGLIVLEAEGKLFCARHAVLCQESQIFRDMLSLPQPAAVTAALELGLDGFEQHEGKPLVHISDKAGELQWFFKALHQYRYVALVLSACLGCSISSYSFSHKPPDSTISAQNPKL